MIERQHKNIHQQQNIQSFIDDEDKKQKSKLDMS